MTEKKILYILLHIPKTGGTSFNVTIQEANKLVQNKVHAFVRHDNYYGLHEEYNQDNLEARYLTFIRHPIGRSLSHFRMNTENKGIFFEDWFEEKYHNFQTKFLMKALLKKISEPTEVDVENIKLMLKKRMWFVGLTEDLDKELPLLFKEMGVKHIDMYLHANKSKKFYELNSKEKELILQKSKFDLEIYEFIIQLKKEGKFNLK
uniref:Putative sulfotransferase domain contining protein n=1 Tax=viral metagenome TaxID=1070528 RepID=A0A6M3LP68_9ZZZZ